MPGFGAIEPGQPGSRARPGVFGPLQANYDLMHAQVVAYAARVHLYRQALNAARRKFDQTPRTCRPTSVW